MKEVAGGRCPVVSELSGVMLLNLLPLTTDH